MKTVLLLLVLQGCLGAFDTIYYHEFRLKLSSLVSAKKELKLHAARDFVYAVILGSLAWTSWNGLLAWVLVGLLVAEILITLWDFIEEDRSRKVPVGERSMHVIMAIVYGAFLATLLPEILSWQSIPTSFQYHDYGLRSWFLSVGAFGVFVSGLSDLRAAFSLSAAKSTIAFSES